MRLTAFPRIIRFVSDSSFRVIPFNFFSRIRYRLAAAFALAFFCSAGFVAISYVNFRRFGFVQVPPIHDSRLDAWIPFEPGWVWVYLLYYPFCFLPLFLREVRGDAVIFRRTLCAFAMQFGVSFVFFLLLPLRMTHSALPSGLEGHLIGALYRVDLGFNSFPSLHLANITFISLLFYRLRGAIRGAAIGIAALFIAASVLLIKQHFVSDVLLGALLGWASFALFFMRKRGRFQKSATVL